MSLSQTSLDRMLDEAVISLRLFQPNDQSGATKLTSEQAGWGQDALRVLTHLRLSATAITDSAQRENFLQMHNTAKATAKSGFMNQPSNRAILARRICAISDQLSSYHAGSNIDISFKLFWQEVTPRTAELAQALIDRLLQLGVPKI